MPTFDELKERAEANTHLSNWIFEDDELKAATLVLQELTSQLFGNPDVIMAAEAAGLLGYAVALSQLVSDLNNGNIPRSKRSEESMEVLPKVIPMLRRAADLFEETVNSYRATSPADAPVAVEPEPSVAS